jgi:hypothetical protein
MRGCKLSDKFAIVNLSMWAEPLGFGGLIPNVEYEIVRLERITSQTVLVDFTDPLRSYQLPQRYGNMVSNRDIARINSGLIRYKMIRAVKKCNMFFRVPFDHKKDTWDLLLKEIH